MAAREYLRLALAIARSGAEDAEAIFVEAASTAKNAESQENLRQFFQACKSAEPHTDGVTAGTLFHIARQQGPISQLEVPSGGRGCR